MRTVTVLLALALLCSVTDARLTWQYGSVLRGLLQVTPEPAATRAPVQVAPQGGAITPAVTLSEAAPATQTSVQEQGPAATAAAPLVATQPAAATVAPIAPAATSDGTADAAAAAQPAAVPGATAAAATTDATAATATPEPKEFRPGVYVIEEPPPPPPPAPVTTTAAAANVTGPPVPAPGKNLMVVMTVLGEQARDIYNNQQSLKKQVAEAAGVQPSQVYFYNQTANMDPKTGSTAMSLILNVDCTSQAECAQAGSTLYNSSSQTRLTDGLAKNSISLLPGTFQVYGVNSVGKYKGNDTLYENKALTAPKPATTALDYNATMARFNQPLATAPAATPGNFSIPGFTVENTSLPLQPSLAGLGNLTSFGNLSFPGALPGDIANTAEPATAPPATTARSSASSCTAAFTALLTAAATAAAVLL